MAVIISGEVILGVVAFAGGAISATIVVGRRALEVLRPIREALKDLRFVMEDWNGVPDRPGVPGRPGLMVRLASHDEALAAIQRELVTNGGASLRDAVRRTEASVLEVRDQIGRALATQAQSQDGVPPDGRAL